MSTHAEKATIINLANRMSEMRIDEIISHDEIKQILTLYLGALPWPQNKAHYWYVSEAKKILSERLGAEFATVNREGYRRLAGEHGIDYAGKTVLLRVRRLAKRGAVRIENSLRHANDLSPSGRREANQRLASLDMIQHLTKAKTIRHLPETHPANPSDGFDKFRKVFGMD